MNLKNVYNLFLVSSCSLKNKMTKVKSIPKTYSNTSITTIYFSKNKNLSMPARVQPDCLSRFPLSSVTARFIISSILDVCVFDDENRSQTRRHVRCEISVSARTSAAVRAWWTIGRYWKLSISNGSGERKEENSGRLTFVWIGRWKLKN